MDTTYEGELVNTEQLWKLAGGESLELLGVRPAEVIRRIRPVVEAMIQQGLLDNKVSVGFAFGHPGTYEVLADYGHDGLYSLIAWLGGWGPESERYAVNAARKLVSLATLSEDTLTLRLCRAAGLPVSADSETTPGSGQYPLAPFVYGGALLVPTGRVNEHGEPIWLPVAASAYKQQRDPLAAAVAGFELVAASLEADGTCVPPA